MNQEMFEKWGPWALGNTEVPPQVAWESNWATNRELGNLTDHDLNIVLAFKAFMRECGPPRPKAGRTGAGEWLSGSAN